MSMKTKSLAWAGLLGATLLSNPVSAQDTRGTQVVVVYNRQVPDSRQVADHYQALRQVPTNQVIGLDLPTGETLSQADYALKLEQPLLQELIARRLLTYAAPAGGPPPALPTAATVRYLVLCYGVPLKIAADSSLKEPGADKIPPELRRNDAAVDAELACLPWAHAGYERTGPLANPLYGTTNDTRLHPTNGVLLVARLDGPTPAIARGLVDLALNAETNGLWGRGYFDLRGITNGNMALGDQYLNTAARVARDYGYDTIQDRAEATFSASVPISHAAIYAGWYDANVSGPWKTPNAEFVPGAIAYHLHSFSAATLRSTNQHWVGPLLARGVTATLGTVEEPYLGGTPNFGMLLGHLLMLRSTFGEAAYASQPALSWQTTVVGDPLYQPGLIEPRRLHEALEKRDSPLVAWSHIRIVNINLLTGIAPPALVDYLLKSPATRRSSVLQEKLADLYWHLARYSNAFDTYETALQCECTPVQRLRLRLSFARCLLQMGRETKALAQMEALTTEFPAYAGVKTVYADMAKLAHKLGKTAEAARHEEKAR